MTPMDIPSDKKKDSLLKNASVVATGSKLGQPRQNGIDAKE
jgi:hypothetical protein